MDYLYVTHVPALLPTHTCTHMLPNPITHPERVGPVWQRQE